MDRNYDLRREKGDECSWEDTYRSFRCALPFDGASPSGQDAADGAE